MTKFSNPHSSGRVTAGVARFHASLSNYVMPLTMDVETFKKLIHPSLKERGFKKSGATWRLQQIGSVAVLNVQKSSWGGGDFYVNLGVYFSEIGSDPSPTENKCHVQVRLEVEDPLVVAEKAATWFAERSRLHDAARLAESDSKKGLVFKEVRGAFQAYPSVPADARRRS